MIASCGLSSSSTASAYIRAAGSRITMATQRAPAGWSLSGHADRLFKAEVTSDSLVVVDAAGAVVAGRHRVFPRSAFTFRCTRPSGCRGGGACALATRDGAGCLWAGAEVFLPEAVVSLGPVIPLVPLSAPGPAAVAAMAPFAPLYDAVLVAGNGLFAWGTASSRPTCEPSLSSTCAASRFWPAGRWSQAAASDALPPLLEARRKAGLGPEARGLKAPAAAPIAPPSGHPLRRGHRPRRLPPISWPTSFRQRAQRRPASVGTAVAV